ncbi:hypothetical protein L6452_39697 [Arctium lappa]|uniref:Uncharacterized protein n=1 Tax=Arctium lappa TaxID=4217 RepID=A0ACB8XT84_ARCLA|nr:hypothetical protein L6452_39697 [Arctium lappa]
MDKEETVWKVGGAWGARRCRAQFCFADPPFPPFKGHLLASISLPTRHNRSSPPPTTGAAFETTGRSSFSPQNHEFLHREFLVLQDAASLVWK